MTELKLDVGVCVGVSELGWVFSWNFDYYTRLTPTSSNISEVQILVSSVGVFIGYQTLHQHLLEHQH